jgi:hypothetical protein
MRIRDPGWKKFGSGMGKIRIRDKYPGSAILHFLIIKYKLFEQKLQYDHYQPISFLNSKLPTETDLAYVPVLLEFNK